MTTPSIPSGTAAFKTPTQQSAAAEVKVIAPVQPVSDKHKVKVNGKEVEVSIEELKRGYGLDKASRQRFDEAANKIKEAEDLKNLYTSKDWNNLLKAGWTEDELEAKAADFIVNRARRKSMTPEQEAQYQREQEYNRLKEKEIKEIEAKKTKTQTELDQREANLYQTAFLNDVTKINNNTWLDLNDPIILTTIINDISSALSKHNYDMPVGEAVKRLEEKLDNRGPAKKEYLRKLIKSSKIDIDDSDLDAFLEKGGKGIREKSVESFKRAEAPFAKKSPLSQLQSKISAEVNTPKTEAQRFRDLRYKRIK